MKEKDLEINSKIMQEIGLEVGQGHRIIDQDTGVGITFRGMELVAPGTYGGPNTVEFDPYNNKKMMNLLFGYFLNKHSEESDVTVTTFYSIDDNKTNKGSIECKMSDMSKITSHQYLRDSLKCADIIMRLNGDEDPNLSEYDTEQVEPSVRRTGTNAKNKPNRKTRKNSI